MKKYSISNNLNIHSPIYIADYLNLFSDYREIKYQKTNVNFHDVKHLNKEKDTLDFFNLFFTKYIPYANQKNQYNKINTNGNFIFILKKITNYDSILYSILEIYKNFNIRFIIVESKYNIDILDKNKDDFLCQYIFSYLISNNDNCMMISNDQYRDKKLYIKKFKNDYNTIIIRVIKKNNSTLIENCVMELDFEKIICDNILLQKYKSCTIPKNQLKYIL